jgi:hypothetical protein
MKLLGESESDSSEPQMKRCCQDEAKHRSGTQSEIRGRNRFRESVHRRNLWMNDISQNQEAKWLLSHPTIVNEPPQNSHQESPNGRAENDRKTASLT